MEDSFKMAISRLSIFRRSNLPVVTLRTNRINNFHSLRCWFCLPNDDPVAPHACKQTDDYRCHSPLHLGLKSITLSVWHTEGKRIYSTLNFKTIYRVDTMLDKPLYNSVFSSVIGKFDSPFEKIDKIAFFSQL